VGLGIKGEKETCRG